MEIGASIGIKTPEDYQYPPRVQAAIDAPRLKNLKTAEGYDVQFIVFYSRHGIANSKETVVKKNFEKLVELVDKGLEKGWLEPQLLGPPCHIEMAHFDLSIRTAYYCFIASKNTMKQLNDLYAAEYGAELAAIFREEGDVGQQLFKCSSCGA